MKPIIAAALLVALVAASTGSASAEMCSQAQILDLTRSSGGNDQFLFVYSTVHPYTPVLESAPEWMRTKRVDHAGSHRLEFWGAPRSGTYTVIVRYQQSADIDLPEYENWARGDLVCRGKVRFR